MLALPFVFVIFVIQFPAGLLLYWITTNCWTIVQQAIVRKRLGPLRPPETPRAAVALAEQEEKQREKASRAKAEGPRARQLGAGGGGRAPRAAPPARRPPRRARRRSAPGGAGEPSRPTSSRVARAASARRWGSTRRSRSSRTTRRSAARCTARTSGCSSAATARRSTPSSTWRSRSPRRDRTPAPRVVIDAAGYRERREQVLHRQADQAAATAERSGRPVALDAMSSMERKVVHEYLKGRPGVETYSEGTEPDRHLVVAPRADVSRSCPDARARFTFFCPVKQCGDAERARPGLIVGLLDRPGQLRRRRPAASRHAQDAHASRGVAALARIARSGLAALWAL